MAVQLTQFVDPQKETLRIAAVNTLPNDKKKTLSFPDGTVASMQPPDGGHPDPWIDFRPAGAAGAFERCDVDGQVASWAYDWTVGGKPVQVRTSRAFFLTSGLSS